jgi:Skp family chaperone for outer membrane proteins
LRKSNNTFLTTAKEDKKKVDVVLSTLFKDKVEELKKLRENIVSMSPKTVSSRSNYD